MSYLSDERSELASTLEAAGIQAFDYLPERFTPPACLVLPGAPYVEQGETFGEHRANFEIWLIAPSGTNQVVTAFLDQSIQTVIESLLAEGWSVEQVDEPFLYQMQNSQHLAVIIRASVGIKFTN